MNKRQRKCKLPADDSDSELSIVFPNPLVKTREYLLTTAETGNSSIKTIAHITTTHQRKPPPVLIDEAPRRLPEEAERTTPVDGTRVSLIDYSLICKADKR
jgi:hypothetical protein